MAKHGEVAVFAVGWWACSLRKISDDFWQDPATQYYWYCDNDGWLMGGYDTLEECQEAFNTDPLVTK